MALINSEIQPFNATAFKQGEFVEISDADVKGKWAIFFFYPADFTFVCPTELGDVADKYEELQNMGVEPTRHGTTPPTPSARSTTTWLATRPAPSPTTSR